VQDNFCHTILLAGISVCTQQTGENKKHQKSLEIKTF
jgi:hypothetical protein